MATCKSGGAYSLHVLPEGQQQRLNKETLAEPMKIEILHEVFGCITWENGELTVRKSDLVERINWLLNHQDELPGLRHYTTGMQGRLLAALEYLGLEKGTTKITTTGAEKHVEGATY